MSKVTIRTRTVTPTAPPRISESAPWVVISPDLSRLTTIKVSADMLCVMPPARAPQSNAENRFAVHLLAVLRSLRLANALRFSVRKPHPHDEQAEPARDPCKERVHGSVDVLCVRVGRKSPGTGDSITVPEDSPFSGLCCKSDEGVRWSSRTGVRLMILRCPDGSAAALWPRSERTVLRRRPARRSSLRR